MSKAQCVICGRSPFEDPRIILDRTEPLGVSPAGWTCRDCLSVPALPEFITSQKWFLVGSGEVYSAEIIPGKRLLAHMVVESCGPDISKAVLGWPELLAENLANPDQWEHDENGAPARWSVELGEIGRLEVFRITKQTESEV